MPLLLGPNAMPFLDRLPFEFDLRTGPVSFAVLPLEPIVRFASGYFLEGCGCDAKAFSCFLGSWDSEPYDILLCTNLAFWSSRLMNDEASVS